VGPETSILDDLKVNSARLVDVVLAFEGEIFVIPQLYEIHLGEVSFSLLGDVPLLRLTRPARPAWQQGLKGVVERVAAALLLLVLSPVLLLVGLAVLLGSGRPVLSCTLLRPST
jgi:hypothetical protein